MGPCQSRQDIDLLDHSQVFDRGQICKNITARLYRKSGLNTIRNGTQVPLMSDILVYHALIPGYNSRSILIMSR